jgi:hypothetical protein
MFTQLFRAILLSISFLLMSVSISSYAGCPNTSVHCKNAGNRDVGDVSVGQCLENPHGFGGGA